MDKRTILTGTRAASVVLVLAAIVVQAFVLADAGRFDATRFFAFFTIQSNLVGVAASAGCSLPGDGREHGVRSSCAARPPCT